MARHSEVTATYRPNDTEVFQVTVVAANSYPDGLAEARAQAVRGVEDLVANAIRLYAPPSSVDD